MAPDTPRRHLHAVPSRYADIVPDGLTQIRTPRPPTERGWFRTHLHPEIPIPMGYYTKAINQLREYDHLADQRAADATFENETRPHR